MWNVYQWALLGEWKKDAFHSREQVMCWYHFSCFLFPHYNICLSADECPRGVPHSCFISLLWQLAQNNQVLSSHTDIHYFIKYNNNNKPLPTSHISMGKGWKHSINLHILDYLWACFYNFFITPCSDARSILNISFFSKWTTASI